MSNRFRNLLNVKSKFIPKEFTPNVNAYAKVLGEQQKLYDQMGKLREAVPKHLNVDRDDVNKYMTDISDRINSVSEIYSQQGIGQGNRDRKKLIESIRRDWQPGGKADSFQKNYKAYQDYQKQISDMHQKGKINASKKDALLNKSMQDFGKSFDPTGAFKQFDGITAAQDVDMATQADKLAKGWVANKVRDGQYKVINGQYYDMRTKKYVDPNEIYDEISKQLVNDPLNSAYIQQEALLKGVDPTKLTQQLVSEAATFAANKYGFVEEDSKYLKNWALAESMKQKNKKALIDYQKQLDAGTEETVMFTLNSGLKKLRISDGKVGTLETNIEGTGPGGWGEVTRTVYRNQPIEDFANSEKGKKLYPGLAEMVDLPQFKRKRNGNEVESDKEYNKRIQNAWDQRRQALSIGTGNYTQFNDQQKTRAKSQIFGTKDAPGDIVHKSIWLMSAGKEPKAVTYKELMKMTNTKEVSELNKRSNVLGTVESDNGVVPSGYQTVISDKNGKNVYHAIISNTSIQEAKFNQPVFEIFKPQHDGTLKESQPVIWNPNGNPEDAVILKSKARDVYNGETFIGRKIDLYELEYDPETGKIVGETKSDVTPEELKTAHNKFNIYKPSSLNKRLENE